MAKTDDMEYVGENGTATEGPDPGTNEGVRRRRLILAGILFFVAFGLFARPGCEEKNQRAPAAPRIQRLVPAAQVAGAHIAENISDPRILLVTRPEKSGIYSQDVIEEVVSALNNGLDGNGHVVATAGPEFTEEIARALLEDRDVPEDKMAHWLPPLGMWFTPRILKQLIDRHPDCNVVVSIVGLPEAEGTESESLITKLAFGVPIQLVVLHGPLPPPSVIKKGFEENLILSIVRHQKTDFDRIPRIKDQTIADQFQNKYTLVTAENIDEIGRTYPRLLTSQTDLE